MTIIPFGDILRRRLVVSALPMTQLILPHTPIERPSVPRFSLQLFKWIGNKQRFAHEIISHFPDHFERYFEPFLGSGAVLGTLTPSRAIASDVLEPLMGIWRMLAERPDDLLDSYSTRYKAFSKDRQAAYRRILASYNRHPNPDDLFFISRSCYGGVVRFRKDGHMSTPIGVHAPVNPESMKHRIRVWRNRTRGTSFSLCDFEESMSKAEAGDLIYCDPPYFHTQSILYGAQGFDLDRLFRAITAAKKRGAFIALSIDGRKKSGRVECGISLPPHLFTRTVHVNCGRSMLRRFQMAGRTLESEIVADRLLLTY